MISFPFHNRKSDSEGWDRGVIGLDTGEGNDR
jgi:hypothetical protein